MVDIFIDDPNFVNRLIEEIIQQIEELFPTEIEINKFCDKWNTIYCTGESVDRDGYPVPREIACHRCIEKSLKEDLEFQKRSIERYLKCR